MQALCPAVVKIAEDILTVEAHRGVSGTIDSRERILLLTHEANSSIVALEANVFICVPAIMDGDTYTVDENGNPMNLGK